MPELEDSQMYHVAEKIDDMIDASTTIGNVHDLDTTSKRTIVAAINALKNHVNDSLSKVLPVEERAPVPTQESGTFALIATVDQDGTVYSWGVSAELKYAIDEMIKVNHSLVGTLKKQEYVYGNIETRIFGAPCNIDVIVMPYNDFMQFQTALGFKASSHENMVEADNSVKINEALGFGNDSAYMLEAARYSAMVLDIEVNHLTKVFLSKLAQASVDGDVRFGATDKPFVARIDSAAFDAVPIAFGGDFSAYASDLNAYTSFMNTVCFGNALTHGFEKYVPPSQTNYVRITNILSIMATNGSSFRAAKTWNGTLYYSFDGDTWNEWSGAEVNLGNHDSILLRGSGNTYIGKSSSSLLAYGIFYMLPKEAGSDIEVSGNINSLLDYETVERGELPSTSSTGAFGYLFYNCANLYSARNLSIPSVGQGWCDGMFALCSNLSHPPKLLSGTVRTNSYRRMFYDCTNLAYAPRLLATSVADSCYSSMFFRCQSLVDAPTLPATTAVISCYASMFAGCSSLKNVPDLPATSIAVSCYNGMFNGCVSLERAPVIAKAYLRENCFRNMFKGCTSLKTTGLEAWGTMSYQVGTSTNYASTSMFEGCTSLVNLPTLRVHAAANHAAERMFYGCSSIIDASGLAIVLGSNADECRQMFEGCSSLVTPPSFYSSTSVGNGACFNMFAYCESLLETPSLPFTYVSANGCKQMFLDCTSLVHTDSIKVTNVYANGLDHMYAGCSSLVDIPALKPQYARSEIYNLMFFRCSSIKMSETQSAEYPNEYRIPQSGSWNATSDPDGTATYHMFSQTGGTFTGTPVPETIYYTANTVV